MQNKNRIIPQMFDVRPVDQTGNLDLEKIESVKKRAFFAGKGKKRNHFQQIEFAIFETLGKKEEQQQEEIARIEAFKREEELKNKLVEIEENNRRQKEEHEKMMIMEH